MSAFRISELSDPDGTVRVALGGELDLSVCDRVRDLLGRVAANGAPVRLDLAEVEFMDSSGLQLVLSTIVDARREGRAFEVDPRVTHPVRRMIELVGADRVLWPS